jgi:hypothetical protein
MRRELWARHRAVVMIECRVQVGDQVCHETQDHDRQSDLRSDRELVGRPRHVSDGVDSEH